MSEETSRYLNQNSTSEPLETALSSADQDKQTLRATGQLIAHSRQELGRVIAGQSRAIEEVLIAVL